MRGDPVLADMMLLQRGMRLSVQPVTAAEYTPHRRARRDVVGATAEAAEAEEAEAAEAQGKAQGQAETETETEEVEQETAVSCDYLRCHSPGITNRNQHTTSAIPTSQLASPHSSR